MNLRGKRVIITGGARGLGRAMVEKLVERGAELTVFDVSVGGLKELRAAYSEVDCIECDVASYDAVAKATSEYHERYGAADVLINNAGILHSEPLLKITAAGIEQHGINAWNKVVTSDLYSVFYMTACIAAKMVTSRTRGVIVNISSVSARGNAGQSAYSAAKAGVNALTAVWAKELGPLGIRVTAVAPGFTQTESTKGMMSEAGLQDVVRRVPLRRLGNPDEVADGVIAVIENDFFNGKVLELDGGLVV